MKRLAFVAVVLAGALALAGTTFKDTTGAPPNPLGPSDFAARQGVSLANAVGCRMSVRVDAGHNLLMDAGSEVYGHDGLAPSGWRLVPWYYDSANGWVEAQTSLHCAVEARLDGGKIHNVVCPDLIPAARFGRITVSKFGVVGYDGGTGADLLEDAGPGPAPKYRIECWGPLVTP